MYYHLLDEFEEIKKSQENHSEMSLPSQNQPIGRPQMLSLGFPETNSGVASERESDMSLLDPAIKSRFNAGHFTKAAEIIRALKHPALNLKRPKFWTDDERVLTYELIVAVLKYATFLNDALDKCSFYTKYPQTKEMGEEEVLVILYNLLEREFRVGDDDLPLTDKFADIQNALLASRTKIMAHMARLRIKHEASSIDHLLPENLRHQQNIDKNPLYVWINLKKIRREEVLANLRRFGLKQTEHEDDILIQERLFCVDKHHPNLLRFHSKKAEFIQSLDLTQDGKLVVQDKSACIAVYALVKALFFKEAINRSNGFTNLNAIPVSDSMVPLVGSSTSTEWYEGILDGLVKQTGKSDCVVVTHCGSGRSAAHLASLLVEAVPRFLCKTTDMAPEGDLCKAIQSKFISRPPLTVLAFGVPNDKFDEINQVLRKQFGLTNVRLFAEEFSDLSPKDARIKGASAILVNPPSSGSALKDPVAYICSEGGDENVLTQLNKFITSTISAEGYKRYTSDQVNSLKQALNFQQVKLILYTTCSVLKCENADVVRTCMAEARAKESTRKTNVLSEIAKHKVPRAYRDVSFEVINLAQVMEGYPESHFKGNFIEILPSSASSGVFVTLIRRRDRIINLGKNPFRTFIASQLALIPKKSSVDGSISGTGTGYAIDNYPSGPATEEEWGEYISSNFNVTVDTTDLQVEIEEHSLPSTATTVTAVPHEHREKRKLSRKAILQRVSIPTYSSMAKKKEKWNGSNKPKTPTTPVVAEGSKSKSKSRDHERRPYGANIPPMSSTSRPNSPATCVCTRHAKNFPEFGNHHGHHHH